MSEKDGKDGKDVKELRWKGKDSMREIPDILPEVEVTRPEMESSGENMDSEAEKADETGKEADKREKVSALWMDYDEFCHCFRYRLFGSIFAHFAKCTLICLNKVRISIFTHPS